MVSTPNAHTSHLGRRMTPMGSAIAERRLKEGQSVITRRSEE
jgi:hypothetical protein